MHTFPVRIYYEDTDFTGVVYHANYLKYFERAREHIIGPAELARLWSEEGVGFVVYRASLTYREGARLGDAIEVHTTVDTKSEYRATFVQKVFRVGRELPMVEGEVDLVCVDRTNKLVPMPISARAHFPHA